MSYAYINRIETAVPPHDVHQEFIEYVASMLPEPRGYKLFKRMVLRSQIDHRYSFLKSAQSNFYKKGAFPDTGMRMQIYKRHAFRLVKEAVDKLNIEQIRHEITHMYNYKLHWVLCPWDRLGNYESLWS